MSVLLAHDTYDHSAAAKPKTISATSLINPVRSIVLGLMHPEIEGEADLIDLVPSRFGSAVHAYAEDAWESTFTVCTALRLQGVPEETIRKVVVNPKQVYQGDIPIYIEKRSEREVNGWTITGMFDGCMDGKLFDYKTTSVYKIIMNDDNHLDWRLQMSIYRWLNPTIVTADNASIEIMFTDYSASQALKNRDYPEMRVQSLDVPLMSLAATEEWLRSRLDRIEHSLTTGTLSNCETSELWATQDQWKYYKKAGAKRATKIYYNQAEANQRQATDGGEIKFFPGKIKRCGYCNVAGICDQAKGFASEGRLQ